jgi:hypothetical protein
MDGLSKKCAGMTRYNRPCQRDAIAGDDYCNAHHPAHAKRFRERSDALYGGRVAEMLETMNKHLEWLPTRGPGMKSRRARLEKVRNYLSKRVDKMAYQTLLDQDLEIGSGAVEGAGKNDDWDAFIDDSNCTRMLLLVIISPRQRSK